MPLLSPCTDGQLLIIVVTRQASQPAPLPSRSSICPFFFFFFFLSLARCCCCCCFGEPLTPPSATEQPKPTYLAREQDDACPGQPWQPSGARLSTCTTTCITHGPHSTLRPHVHTSTRPSPASMHPCIHPLLSYPCQWRGRIQLKTDLDRKSLVALHGARLFDSATRQPADCLLQDSKPPAPRLPPSLQVPAPCSLLSNYLPT